MPGVNTAGSFDPCVKNGKNFKIKDSMDPDSELQVLKAKFFSVVELCQKFHFFRGAGSREKVSQA